MINIIIREAVLEDASDIAPLIALAMHDIIFRFIGESSETRALELLQKLVARDDNQYSYKNCWVAEIEGKIVGAACIYDGAKLEILRAPVAKEIHKMFGVIFNPEDETQDGEYYIDTIAVSEYFHGQGIGTVILKSLIEEYCNNRGQTLGLLVDKENTQAKRLYLKLGFQIKSEKILTGKLMDHLQYS